MSVGTLYSLDRGVALLSLKDRRIEEVNGIEPVNKTHNTPIVMTARPRLRHRYDSNSVGADGSLLHNVLINVGDESSVKP